MVRHPLPWCVRTRFVAGLAIPQTVGQACDQLALALKGPATTMVSPNVLAM
ncbi:hypothetical protein FHW68_001723 [Pseudomonas sp. Tn43]|uniref:hypothetical protein n=1 Tax=Pseudomonas sp. Tn43 TaxID=701213 RepID=UPI0017ED212D|nr:hypothetical protein [Pseudomonas sp. Tn43]MBB3240232.1 hypothetical protein [Pseudomonas sp. Tn43]